MPTPIAVQRNIHRVDKAPKEPPPQPDPSTGTRLTRYFLEVEHEVPAVDRVEFAKQGQALLATFELLGLTPATSGWRTDSDPIIVVNYWDMGSDANALFRAELELPDVPGFNRFNALARKETKNIVIPLCGYATVPIDSSKLSQNGKLPAEEYRYLRVVSEVSSLHLPEFVARLDGYLELFTTEAGWFLGDTYLGITGSAGTVVQIWLIPIKKAEAIPRYLEQAPWLDPKLIDGPSFQILRATDEDPNINPSSDFADFQPMLTKETGP
jgi:hypothetical protein